MRKNPYYWGLVLVSFVLMLVVVFKEGLGLSIPIPPAFLRRSSARLATMFAIFFAYEGMVFIRVRTRRKKDVAEPGKLLLVTFTVVLCFHLTTGLISRRGALLPPLWTEPQSEVLLILLFYLIAFAAAGLLCYLSRQKRRRQGGKNLKK